MFHRPAKRGCKKEAIVRLLADGYDVGHVAQVCRSTRDYVARLAGELCVGAPCPPRRCPRCGGTVVTDPCTTCVLLRRIAAARHALPRSA